MKKILITFLILSAFRIQAQMVVIDSLAGFDNIHFQEHLSRIKDKIVRENYIKSVHRNFIKNKYNLIQEKTIIPSAASTSTCGNFDFEDGTANGWTIAGDYQIMSGSGVDPFGGFPVVCPGGNFSLRLNDNNTAAATCSPPGSKSSFTSTATKNITITSANSLVKVNFAACFLAFPHSQYDAANMKIEFFDASNNPLTVPTFTCKYASPPNSIIASTPIANSTTTIQGLQICGYGSYDVAYLPWQQEQFNLSSYIGQTIKIKLTAGWCLYQYDWGYAYFDVCCDSTCPSVNFATTTASTCIQSGTSTLCTAKPSDMNFQWYDSSGPIATTTCITVNSAGTYTLASNPFSVPTYTVYEVFTVKPAPSVTFSVANVYCSTSPPVNLVGSPGGGYFSGPGVTGNFLYPGTLSTGSITIYYTYTDSITNCFTTITTTTSISNCTAVGETKKNSGFIFYPNPFNSKIIISSEGFQQDSEFILFNTLGQEILRKRITEGKNSIETESLPAGLYIYSLLFQNKQVKQGKLVKE